MKRIVFGTHVKSAIWDVVVGIPIDGAVVPAITDCERQQLRAELMPSTPLRTLLLWHVQCLG